MVTTAEQNVRLIEAMELRVEGFNAWQLCTRALLQYPEFFRLDQGICEFFGGEPFEHCWLRTPSDVVYDPRLEFEIDDVEFYKMRRTWTAKEVIQQLAEKQNEAFKYDE